jgi:hypothetical protein
MAEARPIRLLGTAASEGVSEQMDQAIAAGLASFVWEAGDVPSLEDADVRAQAAALDAIMLMHSEMHDHGPVELPPPAARAELVLHITAPAPSVGPPDGATWGAGRPVLSSTFGPTFGSTQARHATAFRRPALEATLLAQTSSVAAMPVLVAAVPRAGAPPPTAVAMTTGGSLSRPRVVEEALQDRRYCPCGSGDAQRAAMPCVAVQRTRVIKTP